MERTTSTAWAARQLHRWWLQVAFSVMTRLPTRSAPLLLPGRVTLMGLLCPVASRSSITSSISWAGPDQHGDDRHDLGVYSRDQRLGAKERYPANPARLYTDHHHRQFHLHGGWQHV